MPQAALPPRYISSKFECVMKEIACVTTHYVPRTRAHLRVCSCVIKITFLSIQLPNLCPSEVTGGQVHYQSNQSMPGLFHEMFLESVWHFQWATQSRSLSAKTQITVEGPRNVLKHMICGLVRHTRQNLVPRAWIMARSSLSWI